MNWCYALLSNPGSLTIVVILLAIIVFLVGRELATRYWKLNLRAGSLPIRVSNSLLATHACRD